MPPPRPMISARRGCGLDQQHRRSGAVVGQRRLVVGEAHRRLRDAVAAQRAHAVALEDLEGLVGGHPLVDEIRGAAVDERGGGERADEEQHRQRRRRRLGAEGAREGHAGGERGQRGEQPEDLPQLEEGDEQEGAGERAGEAPQGGEGEQAAGGVAELRRGRARRSAPPRGRRWRAARSPARTAPRWRAGCRPGCRR